MATHADFENKRRERERRDRIRKKRIRAVLMLAALLILIIVIIVCVKSCSGNNTAVPQESVPEALTGEETAPPEETPVPRSVIEGVKDIPPASEENDLLPIIKKSPAEKYCYLTFDDGPSSKVTPQILDVLRRYNVKATFFEVGSYIESNTDTARRVHEEGHLIAAHSYSHNYEKLYDTEESFRSEIEQTYELIKQVTGEEEPFRLIRFPGGSYNSGDHAEEKQEYKRTLADMGFYYCDWNTLTGDAEGRTKNAQQLLEYLKENMVNGSAVVLMHDASSKQATADALGSVIQYFIDEGYTFHRLDDIPYDSGETPVSTADADGSASDASEE